MPRSRPRRTRLRLSTTESAELQRIVGTRTSTQQAAYRAEIILRVAEGQTDSTIARNGAGRPYRVRVAPSLRRTAPGRPQDRPKCPPPRQYHADVQARLLAYQKPYEVDPTRAGQTHWTINDLAGALRGRASPTRPRASQQEHHRRQPQAPPGSPGPFLAPG